MRGRVARGTSGGEGLDDDVRRGCSRSTEVGREWLVKAGEEGCGEVWRMRGE